MDPTMISAQTPRSLGLHHSRKIDYRMSLQIDIAFDFRTDTPQGQDPDARSPTLRRYHKYLWSKRLPSGVVLTLDDFTPKVYLHHKSALGEYFLSSDSVIPSFRSHVRMKHITDQVPERELAAFQTMSYTMGGMMIFPSNRIDGKSTINGARGFHRKICDRFDLTVECIRRHYRNDASPLSDVLARYSNFLDLFHDFSGYVEFFLLQDMVTDDFSTVKFCAPFDDFESSPVPDSLDAYLSYKKLAIDFITARNRRILAISNSTSAMST